MVGDYAVKGFGTPLLKHDSRNSRIIASVCQCLSKCCLAANASGDRGEALGSECKEANSTYDWPTGIAEILFVTSIIWAVSIVEMLACDRSLTHNRQHNSVVSRIPQAIITDKLNRQQLVLTNVSAIVHVFSKAVSDPNPDISATGTAFAGNQRSHERDQVQSDAE